MTISGSDLSQLYAMCGVARCGATRNGDHSPLAFISVGGVVRDAVADGSVTMRSLSISEQNSQGANTASLTGFDFDATEGQEVIVTLGSSNNGDPEYGGRTSRRTTSQASTDAVIFTAIGAVDYVFDANHLLVTKRYRSMAAEVIVADLITTFAPQLSPAGLVSGLPTIDEITFTNETFTGALQRVADRIGGYAGIGYIKVDGKPVVNLYLTPTGTNPSELNPTHPTLNNFQFSADLSQVRTRVFVEGNGSTSLGDVAVGETLIPIADGTYFNAFGGIVTSGPQRITYTGLLSGGGGSLVGPGLYPGSGPGLALAAGAGVETGAHQYAVTFTTGAGESLPSPVTTITVGPVTNPTTAPTVNTATYGSSTFVFTLGGAYRYKYLYLNALGQTLASAASSVYVPTGPGGAGVYSALVSVPYSTNPDVVSVRTLRTKDGGSTYYYLPDNFVGTTGIFPNNPAGGTAVIADIVEDSLLVTVDPASNTTAGNQVSLSGIAIGAAAVTGRKVYRTAAGLSQLKLLATIADNTTATLTDSTPDASLGANVPTSDTSGLTQPDGQVAAGSTSLRLAGTGAFSASGGWAVVANGFAIRYAGISAGSLTGIPKTGAGALIASVAYNSTVTAPTCLTGVPASGDGSVIEAITKGDPVNLVAQVDDLAAQATLAALIGGDDDGIREEPLQDRRLSFLEATARGTAFLQLRSTAQTSVNFTSRDKNTRVGREITVNIGDAAGTFKIQSVQISDFTAHGSRANDPLTAEPRAFPLRTVTASNQRYSLEDLLRQIKGRPA